MLARERAARCSPPRGAEQHREQIEDAAGEDDRRARRHIGVIGQQQARQARPRRRSATATRIIPDTSSAQKRAATAGSSMMPTAISVPSAWKPATRLSTTSTRKMRWSASSGCSPSAGSAGRSIRAPAAGRSTASTDQRDGGDRRRPGSAPRRRPRAWCRTGRAAGRYCCRAPRRSARRAPAT